VFFGCIKALNREENRKTKQLLTTVWVAATGNKKAFDSFWKDLSRDAG
jgi:hypothetical protein